MKVVRCLRRAGVMAPGVAEWIEDTEEEGDTPVVLALVRSFLKAPSEPEITIER